MTGFVIVAVLLTAAVFLCLLPPLLRRDALHAPPSGAAQANLSVLRDHARELDADLAAGTISSEAHAAARIELAARVVHDVLPAAPPGQFAPQVRTALALALGVPVLAAALYVYVGNPSGVTVAPARAPHDSPAAIGTMVEALARRLQREPDDIQGWQMLARSYSALERHEEAAGIYAHLEKLLPREPGVLADFADALATARGGSLMGEPERHLARALELDPRHVKALSLSASAAFERGDFALAQRQWQTVLELVPADSGFARSTSASIDAARARRGAGAAEPATAAAPAQALSGTVRLAPALRAGLAPTDAVFIYARALDASGPPLAALRKQVQDLPIRFTLDDRMRMRMGPAARLSSHPRVMVGARISRNASASAAPGDLEGSTGPVASDARDVVIEINARRK